MKTWLRDGLRRLLWLTVCLLVSVPGYAQEAEEVRRAWGAVMANPADLDIGYQYALLMIRDGRFQDAAGEFERMLIIDPAQPRLQLELGVIYFRLGDYDLARAYLSKAQDTPGLSAEIRERVSYFLAEVDKRTQRSQFAGNVSFGGRYQSNANAGTRQDLVSSAFGPVMLPSNLRQRSDVNLYAGAEVTHSYDLQLQRDAAIVTSVSPSITRQTSPDFYNTAGLAVRTGVRFAPLPDAAMELHLYPYVTGDVADLNDRFYGLSGGFGLEISFRPVQRLLVTVAGEERMAEYKNVPHVNGQLLSGDQQLALAQFAYQLDSTIVLLAQSSLRTVNTAVDYFSYNQVEATAGVAATYPAPIEIADFSRWSVTATVGHYWRLYGGIDSAVDPTRRRLDSEWQIRITNEVPLGGLWSAVQHLEYQNNVSNISNYERDNFIFSAGVIRRF